MNVSTTIEQISSSNHLNLISKDLPKLHLIDNSNDFQSLKEEWSDLTKNAEFSIFQSFEWNKAWWRYFGEGKTLHVITLRDKDDSLIAIAPLFWDTIQLGNSKLYSCLRFLGSSVSQPKGENLMGLNPYSDYLDLIIKPGYEEIASEMFIHYFEKTKLDFSEIILDEIPENSSLWKNLLPKLEKKNYSYTVKESSVCPIIKLDGTWDEYQNSLSKKQRYNNNRALRMVDEDSKKGFHVNEVKNLDELHQAFDLLVELHQKRWNQLGFPGAFAEKRMYDFQKEVITDFFEKGWVQIRTAESVKEPGKVIAVDLLFKHKKHMYLVHRALDQDSHYSKYGPGNVLLSVAIKQATDEGMNELDFLRGEEQFKFRTANSTTTNKRITIYNPQKKPARVDIFKKYVAFKRRFNIERAQLALFLKGKTMSSGLGGYFKFLNYRFNTKMAALKKE